MSAATQDRYRRAELYVRDAKNAVTQALIGLEYHPECGTSEEVILQGIVYQLAAIQKTFAGIAQ